MTHPGVTLGVFSPCLSPGTEGCQAMKGVLRGDARVNMLSQVWQWLRHKARLDNGQVLTKPLFDRLLDEEMQKLRK